MSSEPYDFDEQLNFGLEWETKVSERLETILTSIQIDNISFLDDPELQRAGVDSIIKKENPQFDVKTECYENITSENIVVEVMSVMSEMEPGWFFKSDSDFIVNVGLNQAGTNLYHIGYLIIFEPFREWCETRLEEYPFTTIPNNGKYGEYETGIRLVPIDDIPDQYIQTFDPRLPTDKETPQSDITEWMDD